MDSFQQNSSANNDKAPSSFLKDRLKTKILVDGGDPEDTLQVKKLPGFVDGQTTNPSLIAKNPEVRRLAEDLDLAQSWQNFDVEHELTRKGIEKFVADYRATLYQ